MATPPGPTTPPAGRRALQQHHRGRQHRQRRGRARQQHHRGQQHRPVRGAQRRMQLSPPAATTSTSEIRARRATAASSASGPAVLKRHSSRLGYKASRRRPTTLTTVLVDTNGQLGTITSSRRFKEDIQDMDDASSGLLRLRPVTFRYQQPYADGSKPIDYGLIAEEVAEVYPDLVVKGAGRPDRNRAVPQADAHAAE